MARFILRRIGLALITLWLLSVLVFFLVQLLPGNVARSILGPLAAQSTVDNLNHQLGTDKPVIVQYFNWLKGLLHGDLLLEVVDGWNVRPSRTPSSWRPWPS